MTLSILAGLGAFVVVLAVASCQKKTPDYLTICGAKLDRIGVCQRNGGHGGAHTYVTNAKP